MPRWNFLNTNIRNRNEEEIRPAVTTTRSWLAADNTDNASEIHWNWPSTDGVNLEWHYSNNTNEMLENAYNHMTARDVMEMAEEASPERMLRLVRLAMPNITRNTLVEETPMEVLENDLTRDLGAEAISRATRIPVSYFSANEEEVYRPRRNVVYSEYTPSWSNRTINWWANDKGHVEYRRGRIIRVKRYCKI